MAGTPPPSPFPGYPTDPWGYLAGMIGNTQITGTGGSEELNRAFMAANAQRYAAAIQAFAQLTGQTQSNQLRWSELTGLSAPNVLTDAAQRWRSELTAQQEVQDRKLRQEYANMMGFAVDAQGNLTNNPTLAKRQLDQAAAEAAKDRQQQKDLEELQQKGRLTLDQQQQLGRLQLQNSQQGWQTGERTGAEKFQTGERTGTEAFQRGESKLEREMRERMQSQQITSTEEQNELERITRKQMLGQQLSQQESEFKRQQELRVAEQSGYLGNGQLTEAARAARAAEAARTAEMSGYLQNGQLTEAGRAAREQERTQRAALASQLMQAPKDVFRAGAYFRSMAGADPYAMGLQGGGISGFTSLGQRAGGTPGSATLEDVESMPGMGSAGAPSTPGGGTSTGGSSAQELQALMAPGPQQQAQATTGTPEAPAASGTATEDQAMAAAAPSQEADEQPLPGTQPGGPVGRGRSRGRAAQTPGADLASLFQQFLQSQRDGRQQGAGDAMTRYTQSLQNRRGGRPQAKMSKSRQAASGTGQSGTQQSAQEQIKAVEDAIQTQQAQQPAAQAPAAAPAAGADLAALLGGGAAAAPAAPAVTPAVPVAAPAVPAAGADLSALLGGAAAVPPPSPTAQTAQALGGAGGLDLTSAMARDQAAGIDINAMRNMLTDPGQGAALDPMARQRAIAMAQMQLYQGAQGGQLSQLLGGGVPSMPAPTGPMMSIGPDGNIIQTPEQRAAMDAFSAASKKAQGDRQGYWGLNEQTGQYDFTDSSNMNSHSMGERQVTRSPSLGMSTQGTSSADFGTTNAMTGGGGAGFGMGGGGSTDLTGSTSGSGSSTKQDPSALGGSSKPDEQMPGLTPAGPVDDPISALINGGIGMGAGGNFEGRAAPNGMSPGVIPYVDPSVLMDPAVRAMVEDVRDQGVNEDKNRRRKGRRGGRGAPSGPAGPQGEAQIYDAQEADRRRWSDERFLQGLAGLNRRGVLGRPGSGPAGPGDLPAPLFPEGGGTAAPTVPTAGSVGGGGSSFAPAASMGTSSGEELFPDPTTPSAGLTGMDPGNQGAALNYMSDFLVNGVGNADPQFLQKMSKTQRGTAEGALQALGLSWDDFVEAAAQTRFQNVGNVLSA